MFQSTQIIGNQPGKTLLITGGMDGDEYAGIEAAKLIVEKYRDGNFAGRLIVIPIVNVAGFENKCSKNPVDGKFPKNIYPGRSWGLSSSRLVHNLSTNYVSQADVWHDLHGGASDERLKPFVWLFETKIQKVDALTHTLIERLDADRIVFEHVGRFSKPGKLARQGKNYIMAESGELGRRDEASIARHISWVETTMRALGMINDTDTRPATKPTIYTKPGEVKLWWKE